MNFFLDFEATEKGNRIISIGCISENGDTFSCLCKPSKAGEKIGKFVENLTGITEEMLENAPTADEAFLLFKKWVWTIGNADIIIPRFYVYGNNDSEFLIRTAKYMQNTEAIFFVMALASMINNYAKDIQTRLHTSPKLSKLYNLIKKDSMVQKHDALEDAEMLKVIVNSFEADNSIFDILALNISQNPQSKKIPLPDFYNSWTFKGKRKFQVPNVCTDENSWIIGCTNGQNTIWFDSVEIAAYWVIRYVVQNYSPRLVHDINKIKKEIINTIYSNETKTFGKLTWFKKEGIEII